MIKRSPDCQDCGTPSSFIACCSAASDWAGIAGPGFDDRGVTRMRAAAG